MPQLAVLQQAIFRKGALARLSFFTLVVFFIGLTFGLGFWQLDRAQQKEALLLSFKEDSQLLEGDWPEARTGQLINLTGQYLDEYQFLIDNKTYEGKVGYDLVVPFVAQGEVQATTFLVNVGWVEGAAMREVLPLILLPKTNVDLVVRAYIPSKPSFRLSEQQYENSGWPKRVQYFDARFFENKLSEESGLELSPIVVNYEVRLEASQPGVQARRWLVDSVMPPEKHVAYAVQWFLLAFVLIVLFVVFFLRDVKESVNDEI